MRNDLCPACGHAWNVHTAYILRGECVCEEVSSPARASISIWRVMRGNVVIAFWIGVLGVLGYFTHKLDAGSAWYLCICFAMLTLIQSGLSVYFQLHPGEDEESEDQW